MAEEEKQAEETQVEKEEVKEESGPKPFVTALLIILSLFLIVAVVAGASLLSTFSAKVASLFISPQEKEEQIEESEEETASAETEDGQVLFSESGQLPEVFPEDFPLYPGADVLNSWTAEGDEVRAVSVVWETDDGQSKVLSFYKEELANSDWEITEVFESSESATLSFEKDGLSGFIGIGQGEEQLTAISATIGSQAE